MIKIKALSVKFGEIRLSLEEATIPSYLVLGGLVVVVVVVLYGTV